VIDEMYDERMNDPNFEKSERSDLLSMLMQNEVYKGHK